MQFFATCARALEPLLADELHAFGAKAVEPTRAGVSFDGTLEVAYRACLWSRVASRILLPLRTFDAPTPKALYAGVQRIDWRMHLDAGRTLAVDCSSSQSAIGHAHYAALKTKDAIVDQLRARRGERPNVDVERPDVRINVYLHRDRAAVSIDLSGESQHRRGYRIKGAAAPLKESLAAAVLLLADWPRRAAAGEPLVDPMCGTGTLLTEAAQIAGDVAPGLGRAHFGCVGWTGHDTALWVRLHREAEQRARAGARRRPQIIGYDADPRAVRAAADNAARAGLADRIRVERRRLADCAPPAGAEPGLLVTNPPYGVRLGEEEQLGALYAELGDVMRRRFLGWTGCVLTGSSALAKRIGLRPARRIPLWNGALECRLLEFPISAAPVQGAAGPHWRR
ncbi:MAG TPA: THUMP domain-containing protein [Candidatus Dormibacteraeota bacterium]|nr:THUMP domain-containing protein [Candidatus Dormibacteraeota bacterium]